MDSFLNIDDYDYELPEQNIAQWALEPRDSSKLLLYKEGDIEDQVFSKISELIDKGCELFFNNAKVIPARILAENANSAHIEIFLLKPFAMDYVSALNAESSCLWECMVGNSKKWKSSEILTIAHSGFEMKATRLENGIVQFNWNNSLRFATILEYIGKMPLPPYIRHEADQHDHERYQTVYASSQGSVAAPTAGLHFTENVLSALDKKGISRHFATLHVSAGTFLPIKVSNVLQHNMHSELFSADIDFLKAMGSTNKKIAVGTTACRILESLYWAAVNILEGKPEPLTIEQYVYNDRAMHPSAVEASEVLLHYLEVNSLTEICGSTSIMIVPGYRFKIVEGLITNFHQPKSTLLLLISALLGNEWKRVYEHALSQNYRFLSYGDSSLLLP